MTRTDRRESIPFTFGAKPSASKSSYPIKAAHPWIAGMLARIADNFSANCLRLVESWPFIVVGIIAAIALLYCRSQGLLS